MRRPSIPAVVLLLAMLCGVASTSAQTQVRPIPELAANIAEQLTALNETMSEMHDLLERQSETQALELLLKRAQLASDEVARLDRAYRRATERRSNLDAQRTNLLFRRESIDDLRRTRRDQGPSDEELEARRKNLTNSINVVERQLSAVESEIVEVSGRLERKRQDLESWQEILDRRLSGV